MPLTAACRIPQACHIVRSTAVLVQIIACTAGGVSGSKHNESLFIGIIPSYAVKDIRFVNAAESNLIGGIIHQVIVAADGAAVKQIFTVKVPHRCIIYVEVIHQLQSLRTAQAMVIRIRDVKHIAGQSTAAEFLRQNIRFTINQSIDLGKLCFLNRSDCVTYTCRHLKGNVHSDSLCQCSAVYLGQLTGDDSLTAAIGSNDTGGIDNCHGSIGASPFQSIVRSGRSIHLHRRSDGQHLTGCHDRFTRGYRHSNLGCRLPLAEIPTAVIGTGVHAYHIKVVTAQLIDIAAGSNIGCVDIEGFLSCAVRYDLIIDIRLILSSQCHLSRRIIDQIVIGSHGATVEQMGAVIIPHRYIIHVIRIHRHQTLGATHTLIACAGRIKHIAGQDCIGERFTDHIRNAGLKRDDLFGHCIHSTGDTDTVLLHRQHSFHTDRCFQSLTIGMSQRCGNGDLTGLQSMNNTVGNGSNGGIAAGPDHSAVLGRNAIDSNLTRQGQRVRSQKCVHLRTDSHPDGLFLYQTVQMPVAATSGGIGCCHNIIDGASTTVQIPTATDGKVICIIMLHTSCVGCIKVTQLHNTLTGSIVGDQKVLIAVCSAVDNIAVLDIPKIFGVSTGSAGKQITLMGLTAGNLFSILRGQNIVFPVVIEVGDHIRNAFLQFGSRVHTVQISADGAGCSGGIFHDRDPVFPYLNIVHGAFDGIGGYAHIIENKILAGHPIRG